MKISLFFAFVISLSLTAISYAGSATWNLNPTNGDWNTAANWTPATVPNGAADTATFGVSNLTNITGFSMGFDLGSIVFEPGASAYTIGPGLHHSMTLEGAGIINNSGITQNLVVANSSALGFNGSSSAGSNMQIIVPGQIDDTTDGGAGQLVFNDNSSAGDGVYICQGAAINIGGGGQVSFDYKATAGISTFILQGGLVPGARGAHMTITSASSLGSPTIIVEGGVAESLETAVEAQGDSTAPRARMKLFGNGNLYIGGHNLPGFTLGSVEGDGGIFLGFVGSAKGRTLTVGNNLSTTFSGVIDDMGAKGSLIKVGRGTLTLMGANTYLGTTLVQQGALLVSNTTGSGTGTGPVKVALGTLGGTGTIAGAVTIGKAIGRGAEVAPGASGTTVGTLTILSSLLCQGDAVYDFDVDTDTAVADQLTANGITINSGATFSPAAIGVGTLALGMTFTAVNNTSATPISGNFSNLADGSTITVGSNTFQANYEGGDGNDLTLTVVP